MIIGVCLMQFGALFVRVATLGETVTWAFGLLGGLIFAYGIFLLFRAYRSRVAPPSE